MWEARADARNEFPSCGAQRRLLTLPCHVRDDRDAVTGTSARQRVLDECRRSGYMLMRVEARRTGRMRGLVTVRLIRTQFFRRVFRPGSE